VSPGFHISITKLTAISLNEGTTQRQLSLPIADRLAGVVSCRCCQTVVIGERWQLACTVKLHWFSVSGWSDFDDEVTAWVKPTAGHVQAYWPAAVAQEGPRGGIKRSAVWKARPAEGGGSAIARGCVEAKTVLLVLVTCRHQLAPLEAKRRAASVTWKPLPAGIASHRWIDAWPVWCQTYDYLRSGSVTAHWTVPNDTAWWQSPIDANNLRRFVTSQRIS